MMTIEHPYILDMSTIPVGPTRQEILDTWKKKNQVHTFGKDNEWIAWVNCCVSTKGTSEIEVCDAIAKRIRATPCDFGLLGAPQ